MTRSIRYAPEQQAFDKRPIPVTHPDRTGVRQWFRLARTEFTSQFFASPGSRLTPVSREFPCAYLAASRETSVAELWGDRWAAHRETGQSAYVISSTHAATWAYLESGPLPGPTRLCDLTDASTRLIVGIDAATLYSSDLTIPQTWAERIARHPTGFDGIIYRSRHTDDTCVVLWNRNAGRDLENDITFSPAGEFLDSDAAHIVAGRLGLRVSFAM